MIPTLTFKPILIRCQSGLFVVYGAFLFSQPAYLLLLLSADLPVLNLPVRDAQSQAEYSFEIKKIA